MPMGQACYMSCIANKDDIYISGMVVITAVPVLFGSTVGLPIVVVKSHDYQPINSKAWKFTFTQSGTTLGSILLLSSGRC